TPESVKAHFHHSTLPKVLNDGSRNYRAKLAIVLTTISTSTSRHSGVESARKVFIYALSEPFLDRCACSRQKHQEASAMTTRASQEQRGRGAGEMSFRKWSGLTRLAKGNRNGRTYNLLPQPPIPSLGQDAYLLLPHLSGRSHPPRREERRLRRQGYPATDSGPLCPRQYFSFIFPEGPGELAFRLLEREIPR
ncbi:hypothetical protein ALC62_00993, partial [Cyphomyrmex costatus]